MSRYINGLSIVLLAVLSIVSVHSRAGVLFEDGFETGDRSKKMNGFYWGASTDLTKPSTAKAASGKYALEFPYIAKPSGGDSFQEQRIHFGKGYTELWIKYDLYIPSNYYHRLNEGDNNKFFAIFNNKYSPGFQVNFSLYPDYETRSGGSNLAIHYFSNGREQPYIDRRIPLIRPADLGKWHRIVMHFKVPSSLTSSDGVQELWKNGQSILSITNLQSNGTSGLNYMDEAYILGWSNSGFNEETKMYVDDVVISDTPISPSGTTAPTASPPVAPALRINQ